MTFDGPVVTAALAVVAFIVWLVRLEGRVNTKASDGVVSALTAVVTALQAKEAGHDNTRDEVIRLQEQIKHLTNLIERLLPVSRRKAPE
jgi:hypothetical protein